MKSKWFWLIGGAIVLALTAGGIVAWQVMAARQTPELALKSAEVTQITAVSSIEASGSIAARQSGSVYWETTGLVGEVKVKVGDQVKKGEVLMALDPTSAPQNLIMAQADLINAQKTLDELLHPSQLSIANAQKAVAEAEEALKTAKQNLKYAENPVGKSLYDAVSDTKLALDTAQGNANLSRVGVDASAVKTTEDDMNLAYSRFQRAQAEMEDCLKISCGERVRRESVLNEAEKTYQRAWDAYQTAVLKYNLGVANQTDDVQKAQEKYDQAVANLNAALRGPDALKLQTAQSKVAVAEAALADTRDKLDKLVNGADPNDVAAAQARIMAAQATIDALRVVAPFDGEVATVNYQVGDTIAQNTAAVVLVNRSQLHVDVSIDETDVGAISIGDPVTVTLDSLSDLALQGKVAQINPLGSTVQGLVKYTVRVDVVEADPRVLIGMTANVNIVTATNEGALAVPLDAVQLDEQGEFVNRVKADGALERVNIQSGEVQDDLVVVTGPLTPGDKVQLVEPVPAAIGPFGPG